MPHGCVLGAGQNSASTKKWGIYFVLAMWTEVQLAALTVLSFVYITLYCVSALVIVLNDNPWAGIENRGRVSFYKMADPLCTFSWKTSDDNCIPQWRMPFSEMWRRVTLVITDVSEECISSSFFAMCFSSYLLLAFLARWFFSPWRWTWHSSESSIFTKAIRRHIPEDGIFHSHCRENLKYYITLTGWALYRRRNVFPMR
jgi:hypothetical protein